MTLGMHETSTAPPKPALNEGRAAVTAPLPNGARTMNTSFFQELLGSIAERGRALIDR